MKIEVLLATMFFESEKEKLLKDMNIKTDIVVGNQSDYDKNETFQYNDCQVTVLSRNERGVGRNRNTCLLHSDADVVIFADNDVSYYDDYASKIERFYTAHPDADVVIFNFREARGDEPLHDINFKNKKATLKDITKFGAWAVSAKRNSILRSGISFSLLFGGGAKYSCGEDSIFLTDCYRKKLNIYLSSDTLGEVVHRESTWYNGITRKYVYDKGALLRAMSPKLYAAVIFYHALKHRKLYSQYGNFKNVYSTMLDGAKEYKKI